MLQRSELQEREAPKLGHKNDFKLSNSNYEKGGKYYYKFSGTMGDPQGWLIKTNKVNYSFYVNKHTKELFAIDEFMKIPEFLKYLYKLTEETAAVEFKKEQEDNKRNPTQITLGEINKSIYEYTGKYVMFEGTISYIKENYGVGDLILIDRYNNQVHVSYFRTTNYSRGEYIAVSGRVVGETSDFEQNGIKITIPSVTAEVMAR